MNETTLKGIDIKAVSYWLTHNIAGAKPPFDFSLIAAGGSNLTFRVTDDAGHTWALRRPPVTARIATAHDMAREWNIMSALDHHSDVPVPKMLGYCDDLKVNQAPFYVMSFVEGLILRDQASTKNLTVTQCLTATHSLIDTQIAFHSVDIDAVGLGTLAKTRENYVERQLNRWRKQIHAAKIRELPVLDALHLRLLKNIPPEQTRPGLAHGDYRFDNTVLSDDYRIAAVLDWELCTVGDPIADFVWSLLYWADPTDSVTWLLDPPTLNPHFIQRDTVVELYAQRSGLDLSQLDYYMAFSWWKQACIVEGVYARLKKGASGGMKVDSIDAIADRVDTYLDIATQLTDQAGC
tara:strand:- start:78 stop:1127 length:1050 start_codon:yes stop_codon:yes gene_type:complete